MLLGDRLLPGEPQVAFSDRISADLWTEFRCLGRVVHEPRRAATVRASCHGSPYAPLLLEGLALKTIVIGLPITYSVRYFAPAGAPPQVVPS
jgi:hypothetical protein